MSRRAYAEALAWFDQALADDPNDAEAHYNRGAALHALERYDESIASYDSALKLAPGLEDILHNRANALMARGMDHVAAGRFGAALADFDAILVHDPLDVAARLERASALLGLERLDESAVAFNAALAEDEHPRRAVRAVRCAV